MCIPIWLRQRPNVAFASSPIRGTRRAQCPGAWAYHPAGHRAASGATTARAAARAAAARAVPTEGTSGRGRSILGFFEQSNCRCRVVVLSHVIYAQCGLLNPVHVPVDVIIGVWRVPSLGVHVRFNKVKRMAQTHN